MPTKTSCGPRRHVDQDLHVDQNTVCTLSHSLGARRHADGQGPGIEGFGYRNASKPPVPSGKVFNRDARRRGGDGALFQKAATGGR